MGFSLLFDILQYIRTIIISWVFSILNFFVFQIDNINEAKSARGDADYFISNNEFDNAIFRLSRAVEVSPWDLQLREKRGDCYEITGQYQSAISDIK